MPAARSHAQCLVCLLARPRLAVSSLSEWEPDMTYETIIVESHTLASGDKVGVIKLNRPQALNALNSDLVREVNDALDRFEADPQLGCTIITGSEKAFAAGAHIQERQGKCHPESHLEDVITPLGRGDCHRKPII